MKGDWVGFLKDVYGDFEENKHIINYILKRTDEENLKLLASCFEDDVIKKGDNLKVRGLLEERPYSDGFFQDYHPEPNDRRFEYICMKYGFIDGQPKTYKTLSENLNLSQAAILRIVNNGRYLLNRHTLKNIFFNFELSDKKDCYYFDGVCISLIDRYNEMIKVLPAYICVALQEAKLNAFNKLENITDEELINKTALKEEDIKLIRKKMNIMRHITKNGRNYIIGRDAVGCYRPIITEKLYEAGINNFLDLMELNKEDLIKIYGSDTHSDLAEEVIEKRDNLVKMLKDPNITIEEMQDIKCLNLPSKENMILYRAGFDLIKEIKNLTIEDLLKFKCCGRVSAKRIFTARDDFYNNLNIDEPEVDPVEV